MIDEAFLEAKSKVDNLDTNFNTDREESENLITE
jgi:hypothetical protein